MKTVTPPTCGVVDAEDGPCKNVARYIPTVWVYAVLAMNPARMFSTLPVGIQFSDLPICRFHKEHPESMIRSLWSDVKANLASQCLLPSTCLAPYITNAILEKTH